RARAAGLSSAWAGPPLPPFAARRARPGPPCARPPPRRSPRTRPSRSLAREAAMRRLFVVTGPAWPLGLRARRWLATQPTYVPLEVLVRGPQTLRRLGAAAAPGSEDQLVVGSHAGGGWPDRAAGGP